MALLVHKYGGTSLSTAGRIRDLAARLAQVRQAGHRLIVVVSAMGGTTNQLQSLAGEICPRPDPRELDMLLTTGERISMSLMAMALKAAGQPSISLTGSQSGIITDDCHTRARILDVRGDRIQAALDEDTIVIVAGFQGVSAAREITTLGRGGSDVTAVALATRFGADCCEIYTDVDGVYSANPGRVSTARRLARLDHQTMVTYARLGAGVLHPRAAMRAARAGVPLRILSSFIPGRGTEVGGPPEGLPPVIGIGCLRHTTRLDLTGGDPAELLEQLHDAGLPCLAAVSSPTGTGPTLFTETGEAAAVADFCASRLSIAVDQTAPGTLVTATTHPEVDIQATFDELVPAALRHDRASLCEPGAVMALVDDAEADQVVLDLHRRLIDEPAAARS